MLSSCERVHCTEEMGHVSVQASALQPNNSSPNVAVVICTTIPTELLVSLHYVVRCRAVVRRNNFIVFHNSTKY